ncbi:hypothetical protein AMAG_10572 [Allomyces macrogynus ATCC 38327]|uniref:C2 domain-containing protein n=1 Tax=Allomyces macrogynus (strain ATCC 38327) TaxID=578462 RepID=A0A0L0SQX9_ALLM3|nr:hypothetical protein AMAG_10572 [Allomyces macrogynus ATCC 38327]|eukprot:KNE64906.1 hypothetical protein AMAG_10572 [Allomyces macrogynus ATCC 38327]
MRDHHDDQTDDTAPRRPRPTMRASVDHLLESAGSLLTANLLDPIRRAVSPRPLPGTPRSSHAFPRRSVDSYESVEDGGVNDRALQVDGPQVVVTIIEAAHLPDADILSRIDPYFKVYGELVDPPPPTSPTSPSSSSGDHHAPPGMSLLAHSPRAHKNAGRNPTLLEPLALGVPLRALAGDHLELQVWESNKWPFPHEKLGTVTIPIDALRRGDFVDRWLDVRDKKGRRGNGEVHVRVVEVDLGLRRGSVEIEVVPPGAG